MGCGDVVSLKAPFPWAGRTGDDNEAVRGIVAFAEIVVFTSVFLETLPEGLSKVGLFVMMAPNSAKMPQKKVTARTALPAAFETFTILVCCRSSSWLLAKSNCSSQLTINHLNSVLLYGRVGFRTVVRLYCHLHSSEFANAAECFQRFCSWHPSLASFLQKIRLIRHEDIL